MQAYCSPKMMMGPINGPLAISHSNICKLHHFNGSFEILIGSLENLIGRRIHNMHLRAKLLMYLNSLFMGPSQRKTIWLNIYSFLKNKNGSGPSQNYLCIWVSREKTNLQGLRTTKAQTSLCRQISAFVIRLLQSVIFNLSTHNIYFGREIRKLIFSYTLLSWGLGGIICIELNWQKLIMGYDTSQSTLFQSCRDGSSCIEPVLSRE